MLVAVGVPAMVGVFVPAAYATERLCSAAAVYIPINMNAATMSVADAAKKRFMVYLSYYTAVWQSVETMVAIYDLTRQYGLRRYIYAKGETFRVAPA